MYVPKIIYTFFLGKFLFLFLEPEAPEGTAHEIFKMLISAHFHTSKTSVRNGCVTATTTTLQQHLLIRIHAQSKEAKGDK